MVFAGESFTQCPLTLDYDVLLEFLQGVEIADEDWDGTAIGMALINACKPHKHLASFPERTIVRRSVRDRVAERWDELGLDGTPPDIVTLDE